MDDDRVSLRMECLSWDRLPRQGRSIDNDAGQSHPLRRITFWRFGSYRSSLVSWHSASVDTSFHAFYSTQRQVRQVAGAGCRSLAVTVIPHTARSFQ
jgi:hypothetical protein